MINWEKLEINDIIKIMAKYLGRRRVSILSKTLNYKQRQGKRQLSGN